MNTAMLVISLLNYTAVSIFGGVLSASFCDAFRGQKSKAVFCRGMAAILLLQGLAYIAWGGDFCQRVYPLLVHLPLVLLLYRLTGKLLWPVISVLSAYLFCQGRRWFALLSAALLPGGEFTRVLTELIVTLPLLLFFLYSAAPSIRLLMRHSLRTQCQFGLIPALYYGFDYLTRVYTNLLSSGDPVVLEFMPFTCCIAYLVFLLYNSAEERKHQRLVQIQSNLDLQLSQAVREIIRLQDSQAQAARYRHDLRHHLQYLSSCLENGQQERAQSYIASITREIEAQRVRRYCENEAANLILSAFAGLAEKDGIQMRVQGALPASVPLPDNDLCVLLSNSLENALHACQALDKPAEPPAIDVQFRFQEESGKFFLQVSNPCAGPVRFERGVPVSPKPGHGIGVQSICAIVERYGGGCKFFAEEGRFTLQLFL